MKITIETEEFKITCEDSNVERIKNLIDYIASEYDYENNQNKNKILEELSNW